MDDFELDAFESYAKIVVIGVGGAGSNAVNQMLEEKIANIEFWVFNTDAQALATSKAENRLVLGRQTTRGLGAGGDPQVGREAALDSVDDIKRVIEGANMVFIAAGMGGGTGTGAAPVVAPEVVSKTFNLSSDVTFAFGKANLKPQAKATLDGIYGEIAQINNANVAVAGYTDRIGKDAPNVKLSQRRADSVANYLVAKGVPAQNISAVGHGKANPVTGSTCDAVKGRKALIACLAPDRRVEIAVNGTK